MTSSDDLLLGEPTPNIGSCDAASDRYRTRCDECGRRRMCTDYVWFGEGIGVTLCDECSVRELGLLA